MRRRSEAAEKSVWAQKPHIAAWYLAPIVSVNTLMPRTRKSVLGLEYLENRKSDDMYCNTFSRKHAHMTRPALFDFGAAVPLFD